MTRNWRAMRGLLGRDELLRRVGLEERRPAGDFFTGLGLFSVGVLVGAGLGLMFAPKRGEDMRQLMMETWAKRAGRSPGPNYQAMGAEAASSMPSTGH
jgi:hypothetical protein